MNAATTLAAWKDYSIGHSRSGCDNTFPHNGVLYSFDANPRALQNGALQGRVYRQDPGQPPHDIGGFKINGDGTVAALPDELHGVLPTEPTVRALTNAVSIPEDVQ